MVKQYTVVRYFGNVTASLFILEIYASMIQNKKNVIIIVHVNAVQGSHKGD